MPTPSETPKRKLRWYQFSLRTLLIFVTLFGIACSWFADKMRQAQIQKEAVHAIEKVAYKTYQKEDGCLFILYDSEVNAHGSPFQKDQSFYSKSLYSFLGDDFFDTVIEITIPSDNDIVDQDLEPLKTLKSLRNLHINVVVSVNSPSARMHQPLLKLPYECGITDAGLNYISDLAHLKELHLPHTQITDEGLKKLKKLNKLQVLNLSGTKITDNGLKQLAELPEIETLYLASTQITDAGIPCLKSLPHLKSLYLNHTKITDTGIGYLKEFDQLELLSVSANSHVSEQAIEDIKKTLPKLEIGQVIDQKPDY